ncbi:hypothetical protein [Chryseobacterium hagamense]|nr:hypothetical protein [Chryseobacterium hagamense]
MIRVARNGKLKDCMYEMYHGLIDYPERELQKADCIQFKADKNITEDANEILYIIFYTTDQPAL